MRIFRKLKFYYILIFVIAIIITIITVFALNKVKENTPTYQFKQSILETLNKYTEELSDDGKDYRQEYFFYINNKNSLSKFYTAIKHSTPMDYETYVTRNPEDRTTSESLVLVLPCLNEKFNYFPGLLICFEKKSVFKLNKNNSEKLHEIITRLRNSP
jgi:CHASE3 domain sensor protein